MADIIDIDVFQTVTSVSFEVEPNTNIININKVTSSGGGGITNLSTTQTATDFTINSDTGDDALVPLGNGTLAGATLNDYTTAEKNKLVDTYTKGEVDAKITGVYKIKGSVANYAALPSSGQVIGDVWNLLDTGGNYVWTGTVWDELGTTVDISGKANINSPTFTGIPLAPTAAAGTNNTQIATTAFTTTAIAGKMNNPSLTASYIPKALTTTTIGNSRLLDTGTYLGIETINTPTKDITLGYQNNREIGIEMSESTTVGRDLIVTAGKTVNYVLNSNFVSLGQVTLTWNGIAQNTTTNDVYATAQNTNSLYKQAGGTGSFVAIQSITSNPRSVAVNSTTNDVYACNNGAAGNNGAVHKQTGGVGNFVEVSPQGGWFGVAVNSSNNDVYAIGTPFGGTNNLYKQTAGVGSFNSLGLLNRSYTSVTVNPITNDVYLSVYNGDIYKQTAGIGAFNPLGQTIRNWNGISVNSTTNDVYASVYNGDIYKQTSGSGTFNALGQTSRFWEGIFVNSINSNVFCAVANGNLYKQTNFAVGTADLQGGTLKLNAGTGKGTGASDIEMWTGQVLLSGTNMQTETLRAKINNTGLMTLPSVTNSLINGDATGKAVVTKEYLTNSQTVFVPYTGATTDVDLGLNDIIANSFVKNGGTSSQILAADGSVITAGTNITITGGQISSVGGSGGSGSTVNYYLNGGTSQGTFGGTTYYEFSKTAVIGTGSDFNISSNGYIASFITDVADPSLLLIPAGNWNLEFFFSSSSAGGSPSFYVELYKYDGTTFTSIASSSANPEGITGGTAIDAYFTPLAVPETVLTVNDRLAIRVFVNASSKTITLHTQNGHLCEVITTFTAGLTALNGLQAQVQNFSTGTTGTDFAINSSGSTHTFNLPNASATARGVVTTASQTFAGDKTFTGAILASNLSGTNTGDNATNTQYSGLAASKQDTLQSTVNIKSINGNSILGSGDLTISGTGISSLNGLTGATQTFSATTTTGTGIPAWTSSGTNHQLNIPIAGGATTTGLITGTSQFIAGTKTFTSNPEIPVPAGNTTSCIVLGAAGGGSATGTLQIGSTDLYPTALEMQYVKGITSSVQTQLNGKQPTLTAGNGIDITTNTISTVDTSRAAYTMLANNTNASAIPTTQVYKDIAEQTYSLSPTFTGTAPTTIVANTYKWNQVGSLVTVRVNLIYSTAGSITQVVIPLPADMPTPLSPTGLTAALDNLYYGMGMFQATTSTVSNGTRICFLRRNSTNNGYEFLIAHTAAISSRAISLTLQYFT